MENEDRGKLCELRKKFNRARKRIGELNNRIIELEAQRAERTREANAALAERDRARKTAELSERMFLTCCANHDRFVAALSPRMQDHMKRNFR